MIAQSFHAPEPPAHDVPAHRGWTAEHDVWFHVRRAFAGTPDVYVFSGLRFRSPRVETAAAERGDFTQIDHLILHRWGAVIVESKATGGGTGVFHVDERRQWTRQGGPGKARINMPCPLSQAQAQANSLIRLLDDAQPPLLGKLLGIAQKRFGRFDVRTLVSLASDARLEGRGAAGFAADVLKAEQVVKTIHAEIDHRRHNAGFIGLLRSVARDVRGPAGHPKNSRPAIGSWQAPLPPAEAEAGVFNLSPEDVKRIADYVLSKHEASNARGAQPQAGAPRADLAGERRRPEVAALPGDTVPRAVPQPRRGERLAALTCKHCRSVNVKVVHRKDYCVLCDECGKYTPLDWVCPACRMPATIRKDGSVFYFACDKDGRATCGEETVFWRADG
ncbi:MAG: nuclease-related domain-containing protein [Phycisphaerales bacterium]